MGQTMNFMFDKISREHQNVPQKKSLIKRKNTLSNIYILYISYLRVEYVLFICAYMHTLDLHTLCSYESQYLCVCVCMSVYEYALS